jgi:serine/threonine protein kinase
MWRAACREARTAASITHESVVAVHQVESRPPALPFMVMQLISGESLEQRLARRNCRSGRSCRHARLPGLIHRDIAGQHLPNRRRIALPTSVGSRRTT